VDRIELTPLERVTRIQPTRSRAATALHSALAAGPEPASESAIRDRWLDGLREPAGLFSAGWYQPPPTGACVLIGHPDDDFARLNYESLRNPNTWSREDIHLREDSLVYAYASPVHGASGMIGDIGITLYGGSDASIREHLTACLDVTASTAEFAEVGMELREVFHFAQAAASASGISNVASSTASGISNIGHTVPFSYVDYPADLPALLEAREEDQVCAAISAARVSINAQATLRIPSTIALTIEPQIHSPSAPLCSYHVIVVFVDGAKLVLADFDELFDAFGMDYMRGRAT
jgi:hypothetical protein